MILCVVKQFVLKSMGKQVRKFWLQLPMDRVMTGQKVHVPTKRLLVIKKMNLM